MKFLMIVLTLGLAQADDRGSTMDSREISREGAEASTPAERKFPPDNMSPPGRETNLVNDETEELPDGEAANGGPTENMGTFTATSTATTISPTGSFGP